MNLTKYLVTNCGIVLFALGSPTVAQITPDTTLPNPSIVEIQNPRSLITGGTRVQDHLFHSFSEFSVPTGGSAIFNNDLSIQNIFTRVTGGNVSTIDGLIQTNGTANLFLLNPNGILFGANARLNIGGSFAASTADRFTFGTQGDYSATNPQAPPLLTISVPIGLGIPQSGSAIVNQGNLTVPGSLTLQSDQLQLDGQINAGQDLILRSNNPIVSNAQFNTGGNFWIEDFNANLGTLLSSGGLQIRAIGDVKFANYQGASLQILAGGSVKIPGEVESNRSAQNAFLDGADTTISAQGNIDVSYIDTSNRFANGGNITIEAGGNITLLGALTLGQQNSGNVQLTATGDIRLGSIETVSGFGNAGRVEITSRTGSIDATNSNISAFADLPGRNGNSVILNAAGDIKVQNIGTSGGFAGSSSGDIQLTSQTGNLFLNDGTLFSLKFGSGTSGAIRLSAGQNVEINQGDVISSKIFGSEGRSGDISIEAGNSIFLNQTSLSSSTGLNDAVISRGYGLRQLGFGDSDFYPSFGDAGNIRLNAGQDITANDSTVYSTVLNNSVGNAGRLDITAGTNIVWQREPGRFSRPGLYAVSQGQGNAGDISIDANSLSLFGAGIETGLSSQAIGESGNIHINLRENLLLDGGADWTAAITTQIKPFGSSVEALGTKGNITIDAGSIDLRNHGEISSGVGDANFGQRSPSLLATGNGGNIDLNVRGDITLDTSSISSQIFGNGSGNAGRIDIDARSLFLRLSTISSGLEGGQGNANTIRITAQDSINLETSDITSALQPESIGRGQDITLTARSIRLANGAQINTLTSGDGAAGNVFVNADTVLIEGVNLTGYPFALFRYSPDFSTILSTTAPAFVGGTQSGIFSSTTQNSSGGNITINARSLTIQQGAEIDAITADPISISSRGRGGVIAINADQLNLLSGGKLSVLTSSEGAAGTIQVAANQIQIAGDDPFYSTRFARFAEGEIDFYGKSRRGSQSVSGIFASTLPESSGIGGNIAIDTRDLTVSNNGRISVNSQGTGDGGRIRIDAGDVLLDRGNIVARTESGEGGNISLTSQSLLRLRRNSQISATANGSGNGGNIDITADRFILAVPNENSDITANAVRGRGGNVQITTRSLLGFSLSGQPTGLSDITASSEFGLDGTVRLNTLRTEPEQKAQEVPQLVDTSNQIAQTCSPRSRANSFVVTGKGGLPPDPTEALNATAVWRNLGNEMASTPSESNSIVEANHWIRNADGTVALVAGTVVQPTIPTCAGERP